MNQVALIGRLTRDPELNYQAGTGTAYCKFSLAVNEIDYSTKEKSTTFFDCVCFGKTAEAIATYVTKGNQLAVYGRIKISKYKDKHGNNRENVQIIVTDKHMISNGSNANAQKGNSNAQQSNASNVKNNHGSEYGYDAYNSNDTIW